MEIELLANELNLQSYFIKVIHIKQKSNQNFKDILIKFIFKHRVL